MWPIDRALGILYSCFLGLLYFVLCSVAVPMEFSSALKITDLNDFIAPSQECIKPLVIEKSTSKRSGRIEVEIDGSYSQVDLQTGSKTKLKQAKITLNDCLACSGCVTSAEAVLVEQQSGRVLTEVLTERSFSDRPIKFVVVSVSPQSRASIATKNDWTIPQTDVYIRNCLKNHGVDLVIDTSLTRELSLLAMQHEFKERLKTKKDLPLLTGICPGFVCYAEKNQHAQNYLNFIARTKSPQAMTGALVKGYIAEKLGLKPDEIFHCSIMPCFDKKLEASRSDFTLESNIGEKIREIDLVLGTAEFDLLLEEYGDLPNSSYPQNDDLIGRLPLVFSGSSDISNHSGGGSGGYTEHVFRSTCRDLYDLPYDQKLEYKVVRNKDFLEVSVLGPDGIPLLKMAKAYGFRNIQTLIQKLRKLNKGAKDLPYHFVEVMACPSGCLNGAGQIRPEEISARSDFLSNCVEKYESIESVNPGENCDFNNFINELINNDFNSDKANNLFYTDYHKVEQNVVNMGIKW